jgi:hypothetical protein
MTEESGFNFRQRASHFLFFQNVQSGDGAHLASYTMGTRDCLPAVKQVEREAHHSPPSSAAVKNGGTIPSLPNGVVVTQSSGGITIPYLTSFSLPSLFLRIFIYFFPLSFVILPFSLIPLVSFFLSLFPPLPFHFPYLIPPSCCVT